MSSCAARSGPMTLATFARMMTFVGMVLASAPASAAEIKVLAAGATREAVAELIVDFEKVSGHRVAVVWTGSANIRKQIAAGDVHDLVIVGAPDIDAFIKDGKVLSGSRVDLMKSGVGMAVRDGAAKPDISSSDALKATVLAATSIGYSTGPSGAYVLKLFERMGIADQLGPRLRQVPSGVRIGAVIASGEAEIGFQQISELIHEPGVTYVGPLPPEVQTVTVYSAGLHSAAAQPDAAKELVKVLTSPAAAIVIRKYGMEAG